MWRISRSIGSHITTLCHKIFPSNTYIRTRELRECTLIFQTNKRSIDRSFGREMCFTGSCAGGISLIPEATAPNGSSNYNIFFLPLAPLTYRTAVNYTFGGCYYWPGKFLRILQRLKCAFPKILCVLYKPPADCLQAKLPSTVDDSISMFSNECRK